MGIACQQKSIQRKLLNRFIIKDKKNKIIFKQNKNQHQLKKIKNDKHLFSTSSVYQSSLQTQTKLSYLGIQPLSQNFMQNSKNLKNLQENQILPVCVFKLKAKRQKNKKKEQKKILKKIEHQNTQQSEEQVEKEVEDHIAVFSYETSQCIQKLLDNLVLVQDLLSSQDQSQQCKQGQTNSKNQMFSERQNIDQIENVEIFKEKYLKTRQIQFQLNFQCQNQFGIQGRKIKNFS